MHHTRPVNPWARRDLMLLCAVMGALHPCRASIVAYDGGEFPDQAVPAWQRVGTLDMERWLEDGFFCQFSQLGVWDPPYGQLDAYRAGLADYAGSEAFVFEWRIWTDVPRDDMIGVPVVFSCSGTSAANYHFTFTADLVRLLRDNQLPIAHINVTPTIHTYRLELRGIASYAWYIDGVLTEAGIPEGPYPTASSFLIWGAQYYEHDHVTRWDYIRYGDLIAAAPGDANCDGVVNNFDIDPFVQALVDLQAWSADHPDCTLAAPDANGDGTVNNFDIDAFVALLVAE